MDLPIFLVSGGCKSRGHHTVEGGGALTTGGVLIRDPNLSKRGGEETSQECVSADASPGVNLLRHTAPARSDAHETRQLLLTIFLA